MNCPPRWIRAWLEHQQELLEEQDLKVVQQCIIHLRRSAVVQSVLPEQEIREEGIHVGPQLGLDRCLGVAFIREGEDGGDASPGGGG
jgi:hypothetical protein